MTRNNTLKLVLAKVVTGRRFHEVSARRAITNFLPDLLLGEFLMVKGLGGLLSQTFHRFGVVSTRDDRVRSVELSPGLLHEHAPEFSSLGRVTESGLEASIGIDCHGVAGGLTVS